MCITVSIIYSNNLKRQRTLETLPNELAFVTDESPSVSGAHSHHPVCMVKFRASSTVFVHVSNSLMSVEPARYGCERNESPQAQFGRCKLCPSLRTRREGGQRLLHFTFPDLEAVGKGRTESLSRCPYKLQQLSG